MKEQNLQNHRRLTVWYHGVLFLLTIASLVYATIAFVQYLMHNGNGVVAIALLLMSLTLAVSYVIIRHFAVTLQDRVIRAEENMRHFVLTGRTLNPALTIGQVVALRFASDEEFPGLAEEAAREQLSSTAIKAKIAVWRADHHRV